MEYTDAEKQILSLMERVNFKNLSKNVIEVTGNGRSTRYIKRLSSPEQSFRMKKLLRSLEGNILYQESADLRLELKELLETIPQKSLATWASQNAQNFLEYIDIEDESLKERIITEASKVRINCVRQAFSLTS